MLLRTKLSAFRYTYPKQAVAKFPADPRDGARLLVVHRASGELEHRTFHDIVEYLQKGDCIVVNDTWVYPARLIGKKERTHAPIEVILARELSREGNIWEALVEPARKVRIGNKVYFDNNRFYAEIIDNTTSRGRIVRFSYTGDLYKVMERLGSVILPSYVQRQPEEGDKEWYQTIFANPEKIGSLAPPTAGLHFTRELVQKLLQKGVQLIPITVHIGAGTFETIDVEDLSKHTMSSEYFYVSPQAAEAINRALRHRKRVYAVGCSVVRALESSALSVGVVKPTRGWTDRFIYPPYEFRIVQSMITNFHPPNSPSLLVGAALAGPELIMKAYRTAVKEGYRLFAYGDAMLIL
ncbi:MAG: tRNA preQ1(34) S-adenosylmethionine ribosyltransferase-isomerase QueA [Candidatus Kapabacteria bacterium]|nr:tRNA preQ1(34) S-adenosylmethionine ribosyltransferase-isomerase QueA [Candidatus Kapabacteria bacterium]MDW7996047.1 tRNA preQ1(34) S-adenosylmethionine ribosyltransferase-isomerase QueA [Bacteroidota bacterium]